MAEPQTSYAPAQIVATAARDYRWKRFALAAILLIYGGLSIRDGFYKYPKDNADAKALKLDILPHPGYDVQLNQVLGVILPPLSIIFLGWTLYASRGSYRFDGSMIHVPGHPPIPLNALRKIDRAKWDRKGIAFIDYQFPGTSKSGTFKLDDFVYNRDPTDKIFATIEATLGTTGTPAVAAAPTPRPAGVIPPAAIPAKPRSGPTR
jgi:hypothetical protein